MMKDYVTQDPATGLARREFVKACVAATVGATCVIDDESEMKTMATEAEQSSPEAQIRKRVDNWVAAFRDKDIETVMRVFAPEAVAFDLVAPLVYTGRETYRKQWERLFASYQGLIEYEIRDLSVTANHDIAFSHSLNRISGTLQSGQRTGFWLRMTACWRRVAGEWLLEHEHVSVPVDPAKGTALLDLKP